MMSYFEIIKKFFKKHPGRLKHKNKKEYKTAIVGDNFYDDKNLFEFNKKMKWVHYVFKYKLFVPIVLLIEKMFKKHLVREYRTTKWHNKPLEEFDKAYEKALKTWSEYLTVKNPSYNAQERYDKGLGSIGLLRLLKNIVLTVASHDDVYIEFVNMLLNEFRSSKSFNKSGKHLLHVDKFVNGKEYMQYFYIGECLGNNIKIKKLGDTK